MKAEYNKYLFISSEHLELLIKDAISRYPEEACGFLGGKAKTVKTVYLLSNMRKSPVEYLPDPEEQVKAFSEMQKKAERLLAIYHSHPGAAAYPSSVDIERAICPEYLHLIVSVNKRGASQVRCFHIENGEVEEVKIRVITNRRKKDGNSG